MKNYHSATKKTIQDPANWQRNYYREVANTYDEMHVCNDGPHDVSLRYLSGLINQLDIESILDVGCGTGRGIRYFQQHYPAVRTYGVEPVEALLEQAINRHGISPSNLMLGWGESLPFATGSIDAIMELGILHHIAEPQEVVQEMTRVARKAIFLSDENRFGLGSLPKRMGKLVLYKMKLWRWASLLKGKGKQFAISAGDGLAYSYSVFDAFDLLSAWADRVFLIPTGRDKSSSWFHPLFTTGHVLLCAIREQV